MLVVSHSRGRRKACNVRYTSNLDFWLALVLAMRATMYLTILNVCTVMVQLKPKMCRRLPLAEIVQKFGIHS